MKIATVLLAAGKGTRMHSRIPKVLHSLAGYPLIWHTLQAIKNLSEDPPVVVIGHQSESVKAVVGETVRYVIQEEQLGTGHALMQTEELLRGRSDLVLVVQADNPLLTTETLENLIEAQKTNTGPFSFVTGTSDIPRGSGRILRNKIGQIVAIVEEIDATPEQSKIKEVNAGVYCFQAEWLWDNLKKLPLSSKGEYYLTDMVDIAIKAGLHLEVCTLGEPTEAIGINDRVHLAEAETIMRERINQKWMLSGVSIIDPQTTYIEAGVTISQDTIIYPNTFLQGDTHIGEDCQIGPNAILRDARVGDQCIVFASTIEQARIDDKVKVGPYSHLRKGAHLAEGVCMGNFGEVKNAYLGPGVKLGHFTYIGDATIGKNVNIGAGTITCNFDGEKKHHTTIEDDVFIGSDTMLVAPLTIGKGSRTGAGAVVNKDVPKDTVVVGIPARAIRKLTKHD